MTERKLWYAVTVDNENDWGIGSTFYSEAVRIAEDWAQKYPTSVIRILTIDDGDDPVCIDEEIVFEPDIFEILIANGWRKSAAKQQIDGNGAWLEEYDGTWPDGIPYNGAELIDYDGRRMVLVTPL